MAGCIFNAAQLMVVDDISGYPNHKQVADACREDAFGNHPRIGTGDNDRVGMLAVLFGIQAQRSGDIALSGLGVQVLFIAVLQFLHGLISRHDKWFHTLRPFLCLRMFSAHPGIPVGGFLCLRMFSAYPGIPLGGFLCFLYYKVQVYSLSNKAFSPIIKFL